MRKTSFGTMIQLELPFALDPGIELMHFEKQGNPHHHDVDEVAVCLSGRCLVIVHETADSNSRTNEHLLNEGDWLQISSGQAHYMIPDPEAHLLIGYRPEDEGRET